MDRCACRQHADVMTCLTTKQVVFLALRSTDLSTQSRGVPSQLPRRGTRQTNDLPKTVTALLKKRVRPIPPLFVQISSLLSEVHDRCISLYIRFMARQHQQQQQQQLDRLLATHCSNSSRPPARALCLYSACTPRLELGELGEDRVGVLLGTRLSAEVARDGLALGDGLSGQHGETRLQHGSTSALLQVAGLGTQSRTKPDIRLTVRAAFSILSANSFRPMCLFHHKHCVVVSSPHQGHNPSRVHRIHLPEHHQRTQEQGSGVGEPLSFDVRSRAVDGLEDRGVLADVAGGGETETTDETGREIGQDVTVQVGHDHDSVSVGGGVLGDLAEVSGMRRRDWQRGHGETVCKTVARLLTRRQTRSSRSSS